MKRWVVATMAALSPAVGAVPSPADVAPMPLDTPPTSRFVSTVKITIRDSTPELRARARRLVREQFANTISTFPSLRDMPYEIANHGDVVVFSLITPQDTRAMMKEMMAALSTGLNWRTDTNGQLRIYRAAFDEPSTEDRGFLEVVLDDTRTKIRSIAAQSVPLRDLLKELQAQLGNLSYLIPGECGGRLVDWRYGGEPGAPGKDVAVLMQELATFFGLRSERTHGTFIFSGACKDFPRHPMAARSMPLPDAALPSDWFAMPPALMPEPQVGPARRSPPSMGPRVPSDGAGGLRAVRAERPAVFFRLRAFE